MTGPSVDPFEALKKSKQDAFKNLADSTTATPAEPETTDPFELLKRKKNQLLPVDSTAIAPQAPVNKGLPGFGETPFFGRAPANRTVSKDQNRLTNLINYAENRGDDVINSMIDVAETGWELVKDPAATGGYIKNAVRGIAGAVGGLPETVEKFGLVHTVRNKFIGDMIVGPLETYFEHIVKTPLKYGVVNPWNIITTGMPLYSEEESAKAMQEASGDIVATVLGYKLGQSLAQMQLAKNAAGMLATKLAINPATVEGMAALTSKLAAMPTDEIIALSKELPKMVKFQQVMTRAIAEGVSGGAYTGLSMPGTTEEKFNNAFQMSVAGTIFTLGIHGTFEAGAYAKGKITGKPTSEQIVRKAAQERYGDIQFRRMTGLPPSERFMAGQDFLNGVSAPEVISRNIDRGIVYNIPLDVKTRLGDNGITYHDHGDGTFSALVDKTKIVDNESYQPHPQDLDARKASATAQADADLMAQIERTQPFIHEQIQKLIESGQEEAAQALKQSVEQRDFMRRELFKDPLTGVANRRALDMALASAESDPNVHVMVSDLDGFKVANDTHGHAAGDAVLKAFSEHVKGIMTKYNLPIRDVFRYGGDEFVTFIRSPDKLLVERIKAEIDAFRSDAVGAQGVAPVEVKVSTGSGPTLVAADKAMYDIKGYKKGGAVSRTPIQEATSFFSKEDREHFKVTGFIPQQKVSFNGRDWFVSRIAGKTAQIIDAEGHTMTVETKALRRTPQLEVAAIKVPDVDQILTEPIDPVAAPKEPGFKRVLNAEPITEGDRSFFQQFTMENLAANDINDLFSRAKLVLGPMIGSREFGSTMHPSTINTLAAIFDQVKRSGEDLDAFKNDLVDSYYMPDEEGNISGLVDPKDLPKFRRNAEKLIKEAEKITNPDIEGILNPGKKGFRAELIKPLDQQTDIRARTQPKQPSYNPTPDVTGKDLTYRWGAPLLFASDFDKAVWMKVMTENEMTNWSAKQKLKQETISLQFAREVGVPLKELQAHKAKLANAASDSWKKMIQSEEMMGPLNEEAVAEVFRNLMAGETGPSGIVSVGVTPFDGATSKFMGIDYTKVGKYINAGKFEDLLNPQEKALVAANKAAFLKKMEDAAKGKITEMNDNGMSVVNNGSSVDVIGPDGKVVAKFNTIDEAIEFKGTANHPLNNGMSIFTTDMNGDLSGTRPPTDIGNGGDIGNPPSNGGNVPWGGYFDMGGYDRQNWVNRLVGAGQQGRAEWFKPTQGYFRDAAAQHELPQIGVSAEYFDAKLLEANSVTVRYRSQLAEIIKKTYKMDTERLQKLIGGYILNTGSEADLKSNMPGKRLNLTKPTSDVAFNKGSEVARLTQAALRDGETALDPLVRAGKFVATQKALLKRYPTEAMRKSFEFIQLMSEAEAMLKADPATMNLVAALNDVISQPKSVVDIYEVLALAEAELTKPLDKATFAEVNKMTPQELAIAKELENFYRERGVDNGMDGATLARKMEMVGRYNGGTYEGSLLSLQEGVPEKELTFMSELVRDVDNVDFHRDAFAVAHNLANTTVRNNIIGPASREFLEQITDAGRAIRQKGLVEQIRSGDKNAPATYHSMASHVEERAKRYSDEAAGKVFGHDATINNATNAFVNWMADSYVKVMEQEPRGPKDKVKIDVKRDLVGPMNRWFEAAAQGAKPAAGVMDMSYGLLKLWVSLPFDRFVDVLKSGAKALDDAAELQKAGKIQGLQAIVPEDLTSLTAKRGSLKHHFELGSDVLFSLSGQPLVAKFLGASLWAENIGAFSKAVAEHGTDQLALRKALETRKLGPATNFEIARLVADGQTEKAAEFYARAMQRHLNVQYGRAAHPEGFGTTFGRFAGTFGAWSMGALDSFLQPYQYGNWKDISMHSAKVVGAYLAMDYVQEKSGLNLRRFMLNPIDMMSWRGGPAVEMGGAAFDYAMGNLRGDERQIGEAEWRIRSLMPNGDKRKMSPLKRLRPFNTSDDNWGSITMPTSTGAQNGREALHELQEGDFVSAVGRVAGLRPFKKGGPPESWITKGIKWAKK